MAVRTRGEGACASIHAAAVIEPGDCDVLGSLGHERVER